MKIPPAPLPSTSEEVERARRRIRERLTGEDGAPPITWEEVKAQLGNDHPGFVR